jgi:hypothetical protein
MLLVVILPVAVAAAISAWSSAPVPAATSDLASSQAAPAADPAVNESASAPVEPSAVTDPQADVNPLAPSTARGRTSGRPAAVRVRTKAAPTASSRIAAPRVVAAPVDEDSKDGPSENSRRRDGSGDDRDRDCLRRPSFTVWGPVSCIGSGPCRSGSWFSRGGTCGGLDVHYPCALRQRIAYGSSCGWPGSCGGRFSPGVSWPQRCFPFTPPLPILCRGLLPVRGGYVSSCSPAWFVPYPGRPSPFPNHRFLFCQDPRCSASSVSPLRTDNLLRTSNPLTPDEPTVEPAPAVQSPAVPLPGDQQEPVAPIEADPAKEVVAPGESQPVVPVPGEPTPGTEPTLPSDGGAPAPPTPGDGVPVPDPATSPVADLPVPLPVDPPNPPPDLNPDPDPIPDPGAIRDPAPPPTTRPAPDPEPSISTGDENADPVVENEQSEDS